MRAAALSLLLAASSFTTRGASALQLRALHPFTAAFSDLLSDLLPDLASASLRNATAAAGHDALKRATSNDNCPTNFDSCANAGAPNLCCAQGAVCSADAAGHVACCPSGAACTGLVASTVTAGTVSAGGGGIVTGAAASTTTTNSAATGGGGAGSVVVTTTTSFQQATSQPTTESAASSNSGFIIAGGSTIATPAGALRAVEVPFVAKVMMRALEYLPL